MASPIYLPNVNPKPDPWQGFIQAYLMGLEQRRQREQFDAQMEDRAMQRKYQSAQLKSQELEDKLRMRQGDMGLLGFMQQMPGQSFSGGTAQVEQPGMALDLQGGMAPPTMQDVSMPPVSLPFHDVQTETMGNVRVPSREANLLQTLQEMMAKAGIEAQGEGLKAGARARAEAPIKAALTEQEQVFKAGESVKDRTSREKLAADERTFQARQKALDRAVEMEKVKFERANKGLSAEGASRLALVETADRLAESLKRDLGGAGRMKLARVAAGLDTDVNRRLEDLVDADIRIRTGAAANKDEVKARVAQIVRAMDVYEGNTQPIVDALQRMQDEARQVAVAVDPAGRFARPQEGAAPLAPKLPPAGQAITMPDGTKWRRVGERMVRVP